MVVDPFEPPATKRRMYFGHPINLYGTSLQAKLLITLQDAFQDWEIVNPDHPDHQKGYAEFAKAHPNGSGMGYFFEKILPDCQAGTFLAFGDGKFGKGVYGEAEWLQQRDRPIWEITPRFTITTLRLDPERCLTVEATRERIRFPDRSTRPYL